MSHSWSTDRRVKHIKKGEANVKKNKRRLRRIANKTINKVLKEEDLAEANLLLMEGADLFK
jgi:hypothetical protein